MTAKTQWKRATAAASIEPRTEGQRLLLEVNGTHAEVGARIGASKQSVSYWRRGEKIPGAKARAALREAYGIEPAAWELRPGAGDAAPSAASPESLPPQPPRAPRARTMTLDEVVAELDYLHDLRRDGKLMPSEKVRLSDSISKNLALKARLERDQELLEDRIVREHPMWKVRIKPAILGALKPYPDAMRAVAEALAEVGE